MFRRSAKRSDAASPTRSELDAEEAEDAAAREEAAALRASMLADPSRDSVTGVSLVAEPEPAAAVEAEPEPEPEPEPEQEPNLAGLPDETHRLSQMLSSPPSPKDEEAKSAMDELAAMLG